MEGPAREHPGRLPAGATGDHGRAPVAPSTNPVFLTVPG